MFEAASHRFRASFAGSMILRGLNYAPDFSGRATRTELAITGGVSIGCGMLLGLVTMPVRALGELSLAYLAVLMVLPIIAAMVRRVHDTNRRGRVLVMLFMPYIGMFIIGAILCFNGFAGENIFGPDPRGRR